MTGLVASCRSGEQTTPNSTPDLRQPAPIGQPSGNGGDANSGGSFPENPIDVSIVELIAAPERFRSRWVRLIGYVVLEFEGTAVYLHEEDYTRAIMRNALWLDVSRSGPPPLSRPGYAIVEARFEPDRHGHMDLFAGALAEIGRISAWPGRQQSPP
jgi:hypothetical protein